MSMVFDTPDGIDFYRLCVLRGMLNMQAAGMRPRSAGGLTPLKAAQRDYGVTARTARGAVAQLNAIIDSRIEARRAA